VRWLFKQPFWQFVSKVWSSDSMLALTTPEDLWYGAWKSYLSHGGLTPDQLDLRSYHPNKRADEEKLLCPTPW